MTHYLELRNIQHGQTDTLAPDLAKHLHKRQHLGTAIVIADEPLKLMCLVRKQWLKLARNLQRERAGTVNAQKILHLTYAVTRMHNLTFVAKTPEQRPEADIFFVAPHELKNLPSQCFSFYVVTKALPSEFLKTYIPRLPTDALVVDYVNVTKASNTDLQTKESLNNRVREYWQETEAFLQRVGVGINELAGVATVRPALLDDAIDTLLNCSADFLRVASAFQHSLQLAQPLEPPRAVQHRYSILALLAHRVQTLSTGKLDEYLDTIVADNSFFLRDSASEADERLQLSELLRYHEQAGHTNIARILQNLAPMVITRPSDCALQCAF